MYPDDSVIIFNQTFFKNAHNRLVDLLPEYQHLSDVIRVIDVPASMGGKMLQILMNAEKEAAVAIFMDAV